MIRVESGRNGDNSKVVAKSDPPAPPPFPSFLRYSSRQKAGLKSAIADSVTKREIARYWELKRMVEEDHYSAAIEAVARLETDIKLKDDNYKGPEESLRYYVDNKKENKLFNFVDPSMEEFQPGIKDWWTKSNYAYLNQPAIDPADILQPSSYAPQFCY